MPGKHPSLTPLAAHKQLLLVESELNRAELGHEWNCFCEEASGLAQNAQSLATPFLVTGSALRQWLFERHDHKRSWLGNLINGVRHGISIWLALRPRAR
jgi:hypothetical protein